MESSAVPCSQNVKNVKKVKNVKAVPKKNTSFLQKQTLSIDNNDKNSSSSIEKSAFLKNGLYILYFLYIWKKHTHSMRIPSELNRHKTQNAKKAKI